jgi:enterochelin esterase-like enzyme
MHRLAFVVIAAGCSSGSQPQAPPKPTVPRLERAQPVAKTIKTGEAQRYRIKLPAAHVAKGTVVQQGIDVELITYDPAGKKLASFDSPNGDQGPEPFVIESTRAGLYTLEVKPFELPAQGSAAPPPKPITGKYEARLDDVITADAFAEDKAKARIASPRMLELWRAVRKQRKDVVEKFFKDLAGKAPIVEPYPGDPKDVMVTFVLRSTAPYVGIFGGPTFREKPLVKLGDSDIWYLTARVPADSRIDYNFIATDGPPDNAVSFLRSPNRPPDPRIQKIIPDPNNKLMHFAQSRVELPGAAPQPWIAPNREGPHGTVAELKLDSKQLGETRRIGVYTPPGFDPRQSYPLVIAFDGEVYGLEPPNAQIPLPTILDNLIAAKKIPPVVAALVANQGTRERDLAFSSAFAAFVTQELVPKLRTDYRAGMTASETVVTGSSLGGLCSTFTALQHPRTIGNVLSNSGSYQFRRGEIGGDLSEYVEGASIIRAVVEMPRRPVRFYLDAGTFELGLLDSNRRMRDVLLAKGYNVTYREFSGGHDYWEWRGTIADGLIALLGR